jgi:hypothetical protein
LVQAEWPPCTFSKSDPRHASVWFVTTPLSAPLRCASDGHRLRHPGLEAGPLRR